MGLGYLFIAGFFMLIGWLVSSRLKSKFKEYSQVHLSKDLTGAEVARLMLTDNGIQDVQVISVEGQLTDHYDPTSKTVNLSQEVFYGRNAAATAVASHECGHAVQHANSYSWLTMRSRLVPVVQLTSNLVNIVLLIGVIMAASGNTSLLLVGIAMMAVTVLFTLITLPVEFDASQRALAWLETTNVTNTTEFPKAKDALKWAAMTYVVAALAAVVTLVQYIMVYLGSRDRN